MSSRRRSLIRKPRQSRPPSEIDALEASEDSDLQGFDLGDDEMEDLEVVEDTLRAGLPGSFDEFGPTMDSAVMDEFTDELPRDGLWLSDARAGDETDEHTPSMFPKHDPREYEPTEPGLPFEDLLPPMAHPPAAQQGLPVRTESVPAEDTEPWHGPDEDTEPGGKATIRTRRSELDPAAVQTLREEEHARQVRVEQRQLAKATPWLAALGMTVGLAAAGLVLVGALYLVFGRTEPFEPEPELPPQPPIEAPVVTAEPEPEPEVVEEPEPEPAPAARPRPAPAPAPEPEVAVVEEPEPVPEPAPAPVAPAPEPEPEKKRGGLFGLGKKKNK